MLDGGTGRMLAYRGEERFPLCSTFKALAAARVLARVDRGEERLDRRLHYATDYLVTYSPATGPQAGEAGMTMDAICEAAVTLSDNTAGNLMLDSFGGPAGLTAWLRELGDPVTRLDRRETELNEATRATRGIPPRRSPWPGCCAACCWGRRCRRPPARG